MIIKALSKSSNLCVLLAFALSGCESLGPSMRDKLPLEPVAMIKDEDRGQHESQIADLGLDNEGEGRKKPTVELYPGTGNYINSDAVRRAAGRTGGKSGKYTLNFDDADLGEVAKVILSDTLGENYVLSPKVSGRVTLQTTRPLTREELIPTLEMLLRMNGVVLIHSPDGYRIEPAASALSGANAPQAGGFGQGIPNGFQIRVVPLQYIGVEEMQKILEPLLPEKSIVHADKTRNLMVLSGTAAELGNILETIDIFDVNLLKGMSVLMYPLQNVEAETAVGELNEIFGTEEEGPLNGMFKLIPVERMNTVMVITPQPSYLREVRVWLDRLDRSIDETGAGGGGVYVYRVQNIEAVDLADILNNIFSEKGKSTTPGAQVAPGSTAAEIGSDTDTSASNQRSGSTTRRRSRTQSRPASASSFSVGKDQEVRVIPDEKNNSLVIVSSAQAYEVLKKVIRQLDLPPLEVLIDATIVEVRLTDALQYGVQWFFNHSIGPYGATAVLSNNGEPDSTSGLPLVGQAGGFSYSITDSASTVRAILTALANDSKVNVVASPSLMVLNNQEAFINVGDQVPIATSQQTNTSSVNVQPGQDGVPSAIISNQIQLVDTGVTLRIKPRVNAGGMVVMDIEQEANQAVRTTTSNLDSPTIQQRKIESTIAVQSGQTLVLGGLIQDQREENSNGIPFLKDIPYVGWLFSNTEKNLMRTELVVLITPRVVEHRQDAALITNEFKRKLTGLYEDVGEHAEETENQGEASPYRMKTFQ
ncbi:MAG: type II secretion system secretin GspD [Gammaproteobacteria bacterium]